MTQTAVPDGAATPPTDGGALLRVTLVVGDRRADLALPGHVAVVELLPELARSTNLLDAETVYAGYRLVAADGRPLDGSVGLFGQGVESGAVLTLTAGVDERPPRVYDDVVEAMADVVEDDLRPWDPATGRRTALVAAALLLALGALCLGLQRPDVVAGAAAGVVAVVLLVAAVVLAQVRQEHETAVMLAWSGVGYAATAGIVAMPGDTAAGLPLAVGAAAAVAAGLVAMVGLPERRAALVPAVAAGTVFAVTGSLGGLTSLPSAGVHLVALVLVVVAGSAVPWVALSATGTRVPQAQDHAELMPDEVAPVDAEAVRRDARLGHEVLLAVTVTVGLVAVGIAPVAVSLGVTGALVAVCAALVLLLRTRQYRVGPEVATGLACGLAVLLAVCLGIVALQPTWLSVLAVALAVVAVALLVSTLVPRPTSVRWGRLGDVVELVALVAMIPLTVVAIGLVGSVGR
ncbi:type VII secretion integral membrane protein EccD [Nocardioides aequoreus]|uniref:type VII secretion integral membrane protein EccD n=1 Tax=Nocardioides aequoreus TaxID=397278 RepID=UPI0004C46F72|nr:type VII secretion integral membrane protein EccD [Nocardioides aequoreus]